MGQARTSTANKRRAVLILLWTTLVLSVPVAEAGVQRLRADPDTTCTEAYRKDPSACLHTTDHYGRPCELCTSGQDQFCYNADEARWAKIFGASCETSPDDLLRDS